MSSTARQLIEQETQPIAVVPASAEARKPSLISDYTQLFKIRVTSLIVMTAWAGYYMGAAKSAVGSVSWTLFNALWGIGLTSAGAAAMNEVLERRLDAKMRRTKDRPLPSGRMSLSAGLIAGLAASIIGPVALAFTTNPLTGALAFLTAVTYLALYTPLKKISPIATFVGAFPGAMPPLLGWTAIRGRVEPEAICLFLIVFFWQFPHFQAIAWLYREDYEAAGIKMLPVVDKSGHSVIRQMLSYASTLIPISLMPALLRMSGRIYLGAALVLSMGFLWVVLRLARTKLPTTSPGSRRLARQLLQASVVYLPLLFAFMMLNVVR